MNNIYGIILAGGRGERFWPLSRKNRPKQLLNILGNKTMLEQTIDRLSFFIDKNNINIVCTDEIVSSIKALNILDDKNILSEPFGKNTALAIGYAAIKIKKMDKNAIMLICPADHNIETQETFKKTMEIGYKYALKDYLVTFGIMPNRPETGYGYIELGEQSQENVYRIKSFKEKPNLKTANTYLKNGNTLWNSGIFLWKVEAILNAIKLYIPDMYEKLFEFEQYIDTSEEKEKLLYMYENCKATSIDFGVMERAENIVIVKAQFNWDDVGNWNALERIKEKDDNGNIIEGEIEIFEAENNIVYSEDGLIAVMGVKDLVIVRTKDVTFVCSKRQTAHIKELLKYIKEKQNLNKYL